VSEAEPFDKTELDANTAIVQDYLDVEGGEITVNSDEKETAKPPYQETSARVFDLEHTVLKISFDWQKQFAYGKVTLKLKPFFYPKQFLKLNAQGMLLHRVAQIEGKDTLALEYTYDKEIITLDLKRPYQKNESILIYVDYTARPNELEKEGSDAIRSAKGLYFINPLGTEDKPRQIWTQGETQSTSVWLPTIDAPNEKMTHDFFITVDDSQQTFSNGLLVKQTKFNGKRTDHWVMEKAHAPYLCAMVIGNFAVFEDSWNKIPLKYIVEKKYAESAKTIFKNTPTMLSFYSKLLDYPYPWAKYDQAVVSDFVSGAMENTTLTIHGDMLKLDSRELLDNTYEDVIAHELIHHWFGNLVTTESWSNLPLNESFATYGEYLWKEHQYGLDEADYHLNSDLEKYLNEASYDRKSLVRFHYEKRDDMFDAHSYQKGACVLHLLRKTVGDEAFFKSLQLYLKRFAYKTAEVHDLRLCFEEITGLDMNPFFNQWFYNDGHIELAVNYVYKDLEVYEENKTPMQATLFDITVTQKQVNAGMPLFTMPIKVELNFGDSTYSKEILISKENETFNFFSPLKPDFIRFDADDRVLGKIFEEKNPARWLAQLRFGKTYKARNQALIELQKADKDILLQAFEIGVNDKFWAMRAASLGLLKSFDESMTKSVSQTCTNLALNDPKSAVREAALEALSTLAEESSLLVAQKALNDSSYGVVSSAMALVFKIDSEKGIAIAKPYLKHKNDQLKYSALSIISQSETGNYLSYFSEELKQATGFTKYYLIPMLSRYLMNTNDKTIMADGLDLLNGFEPESDQDMMIVYLITQMNGRIKERLETEKSLVEERLNKTNDDAQKLVLKKELEQINYALKRVLDF
jgi:aminopeptidase N